MAKKAKKLDKATKARIYTLFNSGRVWRDIAMSQAKAGNMPEYHQAIALEVQAASALMHEYGIRYFAKVA